MLGRLARWLRVLGFDTYFEADVDDHALVRLANEQGRVLLTRDRHLLRTLRPQRSQEIRRDAPLEQLGDVIERWRPAPPAFLFTRCMICNGQLSPPLGVERSQALLPDGLQAAAVQPVRQCPACGRLYWQGSHVRRMRAALERALPGWLGSSFELPS